MRDAFFKSRRAKLVICPDGYLWIYRGKAKPKDRVTCPECKGKFRLRDIQLVKRENHGF